MLNAVITSKDPWLLARLATDIEIHTGLGFDHHDLTPFTNEKYLHTWCVGHPMFHDEAYRFIEVYSFTLTESNYLSTLEKILEQ